MSYTIAEMLARPDSFADWSGDEDLFVTWSLGPVIETRDSGPLERANAEALKRALADPANRIRPCDWDIKHCSHWAVGWVDHLTFRAINKDGSMSTVATWLNTWFDGLEDYCVADDELLSEYEFEEEESSWRSWIRGNLIRILREQYPLLSSSLDEDDHDIALRDLFRNASDAANVYYEHGSDGCSIDVARVADHIAEEDLLAIGFRYRLQEWWHDDLDLYCMLERLCAVVLNLRWGMTYRHIMGTVPMLLAIYPIVEEGKVTGS